MKIVKKFLLLAIVSAIVLTMIIMPGCKTAATEEAAEETEEAATEETVEEAAEEPAEEEAAEEVVQEMKYKFAIIVHEAGTPFMTPIKKGMEDAAALLNVQADFLGPIEVDFNEQANMFYTAIEAGYDGLATPINNDEYMQEPIQAAVDAGIPVISTNSDHSLGAKGSPRMATVNQDHYKSGVQMGERIASLHKDGDKVMMSWITAGAVPLELRMQGVMDGIKSINPNIEIVGPIDYGFEEAEVPNNIEAAWLGDQEVDGIYSVDGYSTGIGRFIQNNNLQGKVKGGGWDLVQANLDFVKDGTIEFCLGQDPYSQGFFPILMLWLYLEKGVLPKDINTGAEFCDKTNIDEIYAREQEYWK